MVLKFKIIPVGGGRKKLLEIKHSESFRVADVLETWISHCENSSNCVFMVCTPACQGQGYVHNTAYRQVSLGAEQGSLGKKIWRCG